MTITATSTTTGRDRTRGLAWLAVGCTAAVVALDRLVVLLFDIHGAQVAVPGGPYHGDDLTDRSGDQIDVALSVLAFLLALWALWTFGPRTRRTVRLATATGVAVAGTGLAVLAHFLTPLTFKLSPGATTGDDLTFGQAPGPLWFQVARPLLLGLAALALIAVAIRFATERREAEPEPDVDVAAAITPARNRLAVTAAVATIVLGFALLGFNLVVAAIAATSPTTALPPLTALVPLAAASAVLAVRRGTAAVVGTVVLVPLWCAAAAWLVFSNPLTVEPSPVDDATRAAVEGWAAPILLLVAGLILAAQAVAVTAVVRRRSA